MPEKGVRAWLVVRRILVTAVVGLLIGGGIWLLGGNDSGDDTGQPAQSKSDASDPADPDPAGTPGDWNTGTEPAETAKLPPSSCPADSTNCVVASGRVIYVEKVDPDGDGDAHFVTASKEGVTLPGITIFDVRTDLRPDPLPGVGDLVGGAGPVFPGHAGQKQIQVEEFHVAE